MQNKTITLVIFFVLLALSASLGYLNLYGIQRVSADKNSFDQQYTLDAISEYGTLADAPLLSPIANPDGNGDYLVDWNDVTGAISYKLEEADNDQFTPSLLLYTGSVSQYPVTGQHSGTWYYRVLASDGGVDSPWSNTESVYVAPDTPTPTSTNTSTVTPTPTSTNTSTVTPTPTSTNTSTSTPTQTATNTSTSTPTQTATNTSTSTLTQTPTNTSTRTPTPTATNTSTRTPTQTLTNTSTSTPTQTNTFTPTPSPTKTSTPTAPPTPTKGNTFLPIAYNNPYGVYVLPISFYYVSHNTMFIIGEVSNNTSDSLTWVKVTVNFYKAGGNLASTGDTYMRPIDLPAWGKGCFSISMDVPLNWSYYQFTAPIYNKSGTSSGLTIFNDSGLYNLTSRDYDIVGQVRNDGNQRSTKVGVSGTLYNASGVPVGCNHASIADLDPGQISSFAINFLSYYRDYKDVSYYRLRVADDMP
jgi:hypothetical protein